MAEAIGLALAGVGLIGLFTTCLDVLEMVDVACSFGRDSMMLSQAFDNQRYRLVMWAQDEQRLQKHFGLCRLQSGDNGARQSSSNAVLQDSFANFSSSIRDIQNDLILQSTETDVTAQYSRKGPSLVQRARWSVRDRKKFSELISFLKTFIDGLWDVANSVGLNGRERQQAQSTLNSLSPVDQEIVGAPATTASDPLADAAVVQRLSRLNATHQSEPQQAYPTSQTYQDKNGTISVLFVDYGNSCRSPMAEAIFKNLSTNITRIGTIDSAGVGADFWLKPTDQRTVFTLYRHQIDVPVRQPRRVDRSDFMNFDYMLAMDLKTVSQLKTLQAQIGQSADLTVIDLFGNFADKLGRGREVKDPFFQGFDAFEVCYDTLVRSSHAFLDVILK